MVRDLIKLINQKIAGIAGIFFIPVAFAFISTSFLIHRSWFDITENAFSELGAIGTQYNYVFNIGLILTGVLGIIFSIGLCRFTEDSKVLKIGINSFGLSMFLLVLLGIFPLGMPLHFEIAAAMFIFSFVGIIFTSVGLSLKKESQNKKYGLGTLITIISVVILIVILEVIPINLSPGIFSAFGGIVIAEFILSHGIRMIRVQGY